MKVRPYFIFLLPFFLFACQSLETEKRSITDPPLFLAVRMFGEEGKASLHCLVQVQTLKNSTVRSLAAGDSIFIDNTLLAADSARYSGVFYQAEIPIAQFSGPHIIRFTTSDGRTHTEDFEYPIFSLENEPAEVLPVNDLSFQFKNFPPGERKVNLLITDTAYSTDDINMLAPVKDGQLKISRALLSALEKGPVVMQIIFEDEKFLHLGRTRGKMLTSYGISREFHLR